MKTTTLFTALALLAAGTSHGGVFVTRDQSVLWFNDAVFAQTPGQAISQIADLGNTGRDVLPGTSASTSNCTVFPEPSFSCSGPAGIATYVVDYSAYGSGVNASGEASAGGDFAGATVRASSTGSAVSGVLPLLYNIATIDRQRLYFDVGGGALPEFLEVDVTFSVFSSVTDRSAVTSGARYLSESTATLFILEAATLAVPPLASGMMWSPLQASASSVTVFDPGESAAIGVTETILVRPNEEYWVSLEAQATISLPGWATFDPRDYAGLDIEASAWADPVFALNPDFAAENPDIAAALEITRIANVPGPMTLPLLLSGLAGIGLYARRRRSSRAR